MRLAVTVERDVQVEIDLRVVSECTVDYVKNTRLDQAIRGNDDAIDAVI